MPDQRKTEPMALSPEQTRKLDRIQGYRTLYEMAVIRADGAKALVCGHTKRRQDQRSGGFGIIGCRPPGFGLAASCHLG